MDQQCNAVEKNIIPKLKCSKYRSMALTHAFASDQSHDSLIHGTNVWDVRKPQVGCYCYDEVRRLVTIDEAARTVLRARCTGALYCFHIFNFIKNMNYAGDRKFTGVYVCRKLSE